MKITFNQFELQRIITCCGAAIYTRTVAPVLGCLKIVAQTPLQATVTATDLEQTLVLTLDLSVHAEPGTCLVPFLDLKNQIKAFTKPYDTLTIATLEDDTVELTSETSAGIITVTLPRMDPDVYEFPETLKCPELREADAGAFLRAFRCAHVSATKDETRYVLKGVYADVVNSVLIATNGSSLIRMAVADLGEALDTGVIIPVTKVLLKLLPAKDRFQIGVACPLGDPVLVIESGDILYFVKSIGGTYPNYVQVIPDRFVATAEFPESAIDVLKSFAPYLSKEDILGVVLMGRRGKLAIGVKTDACCSVLRIPDGSFSEGQEMVVTMDYTYLMSALKAGFRTMRFSDRFSPTLFTNGDGGDYVIMPLRGTEVHDLKEKFDAVLGMSEELEDVRG